MKVRKKLIIAGFAILSLLITTVTTTFAWFSLNDAAWVDNFEMEIYFLLIFSTLIQLEVGGGGGLVAKSLL